MVVMRPLLSFLCIIIIFGIVHVSGVSIQNILQGNSILFNVPLNGGGYGYSAPPTFQYAYFPNVNISLYQEWTIESWVYMGNGFESINHPLFYYGKDANNALFLTLNTDPLFPSQAAPKLIVRYNGVDIVALQFAQIISPNVWYHVAITYSATGGAIYFNERVSATAFTTWNLIGSQLITVPIPPEIFAGGFLQIAAWNKSLPVLAEVASGDVSFPGIIDELRIWSSVKTLDVIRADSLKLLSGYEQNLVAYYSFDQGAGTTLFDATPAKRDGYIGESPFGVVLPLYIPHTRQFTNNGGTGSFIPIIGAASVVSFNGSSSWGIVAPTSVYDINVVSPQSAGVLCRNPGCSPVIVPGTAYSGPLDFSYVADRRSCGTNQTFTLVGMLVAAPGDNMTFSVEVGGISPSLDLQNYTLPAVGGSLTISGNDFGLIGSLQSSTSEFVSVQLGAANFQCTQAAVQSSGIVCNIAPGVGSNGRITVSLCGGKVLAFSPYFSYHAPQVTIATLRESTVNSSFLSTIEILGTNFGPSRAFNQDAQNFIFINSTACTVQSINDTQIICSTPTYLSDKESYLIRVSIASQEFDFGFNYVLCPRPCMNGGTCIGYNLCECKSTGFEGPQCDVTLICQPACLHNGTCIRSTNDTNRLVCECVPPYLGDDCSQVPPEPVAPPGDIIINNGSQDLTLAIGLGAGGGGLALILMIGAGVGWFMFYKQKKRGTKNFIPLEKKDFTKIIYGDQLNNDPEKTHGDTSQLEKLLLEDDLKLAFTVSNITQITEADKIAKALVIVFQDNNKVLSLLQAFIDEEVKTTESAGTLFRSNSMVSKMFKFYSRLLGLPYLYTTIAPEIDELITAQLGLEVDPEKMTEGTDLDEMRWMLMAQSQKILKQVLNSSEDCPSQFRALFSHLKYVVGQRFPDNVNTTIGGFIFLRFFCPAVSSPEAYGILEEPPSPSARRLLILITKVLQNLSNDVEFGSKEPYMSKMNDFIQSNRAKLSVFYEKLVKPTIKPNTDCTLPKNMKSISLAVLSNHIRNNIEQIENTDLRKQLDAIV